MVCLKVAIKSALLGNMHPEVGATLHNMGTVAYLLAQYEIAARVWLQVLRFSPTFCSATASPYAYSRSHS